MISGDIKKILEAGVQAPSGENCQPWKFVVTGNEINIFNLPEKDQSLYNFKQLGSFVAHGALIENIVITASALGYHSLVSVFPDEENRDYTAKISLERRGFKEENLFKYIYERATNRKPYESRPIGSEQRTELIKSVQEIPGTELRFIERAKMASLSQAFSQGDRLLFENRKLHDFLFSHINWTAEEEQTKKSGFYIKTLELAPQQEKGFKVFRKWVVLRFLNKLGFSRFIAKSNERLYSTSSTFGAILVNGDSPEDFLTGGRAMQRVWLTATRLGLSIQPLTAITFFIQRVKENIVGEFSLNQIEIIKDAYVKISEGFHAGAKIIAMPFRIGFGGRPSARSLRLPPEVIFK